MPNQAPPDPKSVFTEIFQRNAWKGTVRSGPGSTIAATALVRAGLRKVFSEMNIRSLCDAPCGDGSWIFEAALDLDLYLGVDVVSDVVTANLLRGLPPTHLFAVGDITKDTLPKVDAILCRDCLVHFPLQLALDTLQLLRASGSKYLIATTFPQHDDNAEARLGSWRPLNMQAAPFHLPEPIRLIGERQPDLGDKHNDKSLGVWELASL